MPGLFFPFPMIKRLAHLCLITDRTREMITFYRDVLGFPVQFTMNHTDGTAFGWYFDLGNETFLELFDQQGMVRQWGGDVTQLRSVEGSYYHHFCLQVDDMDTVRQTLTQRGVEVTAIVTGMDHSRQCWIRDPDGNRIELMEYTAKSLQVLPAGGEAR